MTIVESQRIVRMVFDTITEVRFNIYNTILSRLIFCNDICHLMSNYCSCALHFINADF